MYNSILFYSIPRSGTKVARRYVSSKSNLLDKGEITSFESFKNLSIDPFVATIHSYVGISCDDIIEKSNEINSKLIVLVRPNLFDFIVSTVASNILKKTLFLPGEEVTISNMQAVYDSVFSLPTHMRTFKLAAFKLIKAGACIRFPPAITESLDNNTVYEFSANQQIKEFKKQYENQFVLKNVKNYRDWDKFCSLGKHLSEEDLRNIKHSV